MRTENDRSGDRLIHDLKERVKELDCLYGISELVETPEITIEGILNGATRVLSLAWQYPKITVVKIVLDDGEYISGNWLLIKSMQTADLVVEANKRGFISVGYTEERPEKQEGPFLKEERFLLDTIAETLGKTVERLENKEIIVQSEEKYRDLYENAPNAYFSVGTDGIIKKVNKKASELMGRDPVGDPIISLYADTTDGKEKAKGIFEKFKSGQKIENEELQMQRSDSKLVWVSLSVTPIKDEAGNVVESRSVAVDITGRKTYDTSLKTVKEQWEKTFNSVSDSIFLMNRANTVLQANPATAELLGIPIEEIMGKKCYRLIHGLDFPPDSCVTCDALTRGVSCSGELYEPFLDKYLSVSADSVLGTDGNVEFVVHMIRDITERKQTEERKGLLAELLLALNNPKEGKDEITRLLYKIRDFTGFEAVGIRLKEGEDYPYYETSGFPEHFVELERHLCTYENGEVLKDTEGNVVLECMCGNVIQGRTDPSLPFFTEGGSFWSSCTSEMLASTTEEDRQARTRNRCNGEGYESVALIPLKSVDETVGLLQFNDKRKGMFTLDLIEFFEEVGSSIGIVLARKKTESQLEESEAKYRDLFDNANDLIQSVDTEGNFLYVNNAWKKTLGYSDDEVKDLKVFNIIRPDRIEAFIGEFKDVMVEGKNVSNVQTTFVGKNGQEIEVEGSGGAILKDGKIEGGRGIFRDVTKRKQWENVLKAAEEKFRVLAETLPQAVYEFNFEGKFLYANSKGFEMFGYEYEDMDKVRVKDLIDPSDYESVERAVIKVLDGRSDGAVREYLFKRKDGSTFPGRAYTTLISDNKGERTGIRGIMIDITEEKEREDELRRRNIELKGFAHTVSHDLKGPISAVSMACEMTGDKVQGELPEDVYKEVNEMMELGKRGIQRAESLINDLLFLAEAGKPTDVYPVNLNERIDEVIAENKPEIEERNIEIKVDPNLGKVVANPTHMYQVFANLVKNCVRHCESEKPVLAIRKIADEGSVHSFQVRDNGEGISEDVLDDIFIPFVKSSSKGNTGMGLSIVEKIVKTYGGEIKAYNDNGAVFEFTLEDWLVP